MRNISGPSSNEYPMGIVIVDDQASVAYALQGALTHALNGADRTYLPPVEVHVVVNPGDSADNQRELGGVIRRLPNRNRFHAIEKRYATNRDVVRFVIGKLITQSRGCLVVCDRAMPIPGPALLGELSHHVTTFDKAKVARGIPDRKALWAYHSADPPCIRTTPAWEAGSYAFAIRKPVDDIQAVAASLGRLMVPAQHERIPPSTTLERAHRDFVEALNAWRLKTTLEILAPHSLVS